MAETGKLVVDVAVGSFVFVRTVDEVAEYYDTITKRVMKPALDQFAVGDDSHRGVGKGLVSPSATADSTRWSAEVARGETTSGADHLEKTFRATRTAADTMDTGDSGVAFIQDYVEPGYFLDDYTGESRGW